MLSSRSSQLEAFVRQTLFRDAFVFKSVERPVIQLPQFADQHLTSVCLRPRRKQKLDFVNPINLTFQSLPDIIPVGHRIFDLAVSLNLFGRVQLAEHVLRESLFFTSSTKFVVGDRPIHVLNRLAVEYHLEPESCESIAELNVFRAETELLIENTVMHQQRPFAG